MVCPKKLYTSYKKSNKFTSRCLKRNIIFIKKKRNETLLCLINRDTPSCNFLKCMCDALYRLWYIFFIYIIILSYDYFIWILKYKLTFQQNYYTEDGRPCLSVNWICMHRKEMSKASNASTFLAYLDLNNQ